MAKTNIEIKQLETGFLVTVSYIEQRYEAPAMPVQAHPPMPMPAKSPHQPQGAWAEQAPPPPAYYPPVVHAFSTVEEVAKFVTEQYEFA
jgi:hypothetical protein